MTEGSPFAGAAPAAPAPALSARPLPITIICVIGVIGALIALTMVFWSEAAQIAPWYPVVLAASAVIGLACMIGLWRMRRWSVYVYTAMCAVTQLLFAATDLWTPRSLFIPAVVVIIMFIYLPRMR